MLIVKVEDEREVEEARNPLKQSFFDEDDDATVKRLEEWGKAHRAELEVEKAEGEAERAQVSGEYFGGGTSAVSILPVSASPALSAFSIEREPFPSTNLGGGGVLEVCAHSSTNLIDNLFQGQATAIRDLKDTNAQLAELESRVESLETWGIEFHEEMKSLGRRLDTIEAQIRLLLEERQL